MLIIGCDFHPGFQQVAIFDNRTGEVQEKRLQHREEAERFYRGLSGPARVGMEACGHYPWFERRLAELGCEWWFGDAAQVRASVVRRQKTDGGDAEHLLQLLREERFRKIWVPSLEEREVRQLLVHRHQPVQARTRTKNQLQAMALSHGVQKKRKLWSPGGRVELEQLPRLPYAAERRQRRLQAAGRTGRGLARTEPAGGGRSPPAAAGAVADHASGGGSGHRVGQGVDPRPGRALCLGQRCGQLLRADSPGRFQRRTPAAGQDQPTGQFVSALFAGGSGTDGGALRSAAATLLSPPGAAQKSRRRQGGRGPQVGHAVVPEVAPAVDLRATRSGRYAGEPESFCGSEK